MDLCLYWHIVLVTSKHVEKMACTITNSESAQPEFIRKIENKSEHNQKYKNQANSKYKC